MAHTIKPNPKTLLKGGTDKPTDSTRKRRPYPKSWTELEERIYEVADASSRHFIAVLADAILTLPNINAKTQEAADKKGFRVLDRLRKAYVRAQVDACKASYVTLLNIITNK